MNVRKTRTEAFNTYCTYCPKTKGGINMFDEINEIAEEYNATEEEAEAIAYFYADSFFGDSSDSTD